MGSVSDARAPASSCSARGEREIEPAQCDPQAHVRQPWKDVRAGGVRARPQLIGRIGQRQLARAEIQCVNRGERCLLRGRRARLGLHREARQPRIDLGIDPGGPGRGEHQQARARVVRGERQRGVAQLVGRHGAFQHERAYLIDQLGIELALGEIQARARAFGESQQLLDRVRSRRGVGRSRGRNQRRAAVLAGGAPLALDGLFDVRGRDALARLGTPAQPPAEQCERHRGQQDRQRCSGAHGGLSRSGMVAAQSAPAAEVPARASRSTRASRATRANGAARGATRREP